MIFETKENKFKPTIRINYNKDMQPQVTELQIWTVGSAAQPLKRKLIFLNLKIWKSFI